jgi:hypothetical protein
VPVCVIPLLSFKLSSGCLFSPHHVNQGGVQKATVPQVTLYEPHTSEVLKGLSGDAEVASTVRYCRWSCGPSEGTLARAASTTSEGLCQGPPVALSCRHLARPSHCHRHRHHGPLMCCHPALVRGHSKH